MQGKIEKARSYDLVEILYLVKVCVRDMNSKGIKHWNSAYPDAELIQSDLDSDKLYLYKDKGVCKGMISLSDIKPDEYKNLEASNNDDRVLYLQRLAVHPLWQNSGIAKSLLEYAENYAKKNNYKSIKIDVFSEQHFISELSENHNFSEAGKFHSDFQKAPFICYEKKL